jgi:hypothetical protein
VDAKLQRRAFFISDRSVRYFFVTPGTSFEPLNLVKFSTVFLLSCTLIGLVLPTFRGLAWKSDRTAIFFVAMFVIALTTVLVFSTRS